MSMSDDVTTFMNTPMTYFENSITKMHSVPRAELLELQREAMVRRVSEHIEKIEMVRKLSDRTGIKQVSKFEDVVPLFFAHTAYKSYPPKLLDEKRWDLLTKWLNKLTTIDLSKADLSDAKTFDQFLEQLEDQTGVQMITSSGTTGTVSLIPKDTHTTIEGTYIWKQMLFQKFGTEPTDHELNAVVDVIWPNYSGGRFGNMRMVPWLKRDFTGGDESKFHALYPNPIDSDLMMLGAKMRGAAARGELDKLQVDPELLARKDELIALQSRQAEDVPAFMQRMSAELAGKRVFMMTMYNLAYMLAKTGMENGTTVNFSPDSAILTGGGAKGVVLPEGYMEVIKEYYGNDIQEGYAFSEHNGVHWRCNQDRYHMQPWVIPYVLDPVTNEQLPMEGTQTGRFAVYDFYNQSHWGGVTTGDRVTVHYTDLCPCGRTTLYIDNNIQRFSELNPAEDDKISCAATATVQDEAIDFLKGIG
jgi:hypothetical protein